MSWHTHNTKICIGTPGSGTEIIIPVDSLAIRAVPYVGSGGTAIDLFDGRKKLSVPTWGYRADLSWNFWRTEYQPATMGNIWDAVNKLLASNSGQDIYFHHDGTDWDITKVVNGMIPDLSEGAVQAVFEGRARKKPAELTLVSINNGYDIDHINWIL